MASPVDWGISTNQNVPFYTSTKNDSQKTAGTFDLVFWDTNISLPTNQIRRFFIEILLATMDYDRFYFLMVGEAKKLRREQYHAAVGNDGGGLSCSHK